MTTLMEPVEQKQILTVRRRPWALVSFVLLLLMVVVVTVLYRTVPGGNAGPGPVDAIIVLGTPTDLHGKLTEMQRWRTDEAVREYRLKAAPRILFSGGPTSHGFVEADAMAAYARQLGVPATAVMEDRRAMTTLENIANSAQMLEAHGWRRVEVVSTAQHLPRAAVLLHKTDLQWRTHAAPTPDRGWADTTLSWIEEAIGTAAWRVFGRHAEPVLHVLARGQHSIGYGVRWVLYRIQDRLAR